MNGAVRSGIDNKIAAKAMRAYHGLTTIKIKTCQQAGQSS